MERRSTRGRQSVDSPTVESEKPEKTPAASTPAPKSAVAPPAAPPAKDDKKEKEKPAQPAATPAAAPPPSAESAKEENLSSEAEVVLNRRGMPQRQRKRNRFYFDDDVMITNETPGRKGSKSPLKKVKIEPLDEDEAEVSISTPSKSPQGPRRPGRPAKTRDDDPPAPPTPKTSKADANALSAKKAIESAKKVGMKSSGRGPGRPPLSAAVIEQRNSKTPSTSSPSSQKFSIRLAGRPSNEYSKKDRSYSTVKDSGKSPSPPKTPTVPPVKIKKETIEGGGSAGTRRAEKEHKETREKQLHQRDQERVKALEKEKREVKKEKDTRVFASPIKSKRDSSPTFERGGLNPPLLTPELIIDQQKASQDKKTAQDISLRLRNLLKLPKAHKWVCYEWFYSNIDKVLFEGENDFQICLKESFPQMKVRKMTRVEWCKIRRLMGKPRRCSQAFFDEEREELSRRRQKIRLIQQRKVTDFNYKELPDEIPLQLVIGTKVTARLRRPQDGLFTGTIEGVDTSNSTYRITFDRAGLGTHSIPDYEVLSNDTPETVSTSSFALKIPRRSFGGSGFKFNTSAMNEEGMSGFPKSPFPVDGMLGGFPIRLLDMIVRLSKLLKSKREKILGLKELNVEAEKLRSYSKIFNDDFRLRYARCVLDLDSMNKEMSMYLDGIQQYCLEVMYQIAPDHGSNQMIVPEHVQETCRQEALLVVDTYNNKQNRNCVHGPKSLNLISNLASLLLQIKTLGNGDRNLYELKSIKDTLRDIKASLEGKNIQLFQDRIEIPMNRIQAGLSYANPNKSFA